MTGGIISGKSFHTLKSLDMRYSDHGKEENVSNLINLVANAAQLNTLLIRGQKGIVKVSIKVVYSS